MFSIKSVDFFYLANKFRPNSKIGLCTGIFLAAECMRSPEKTKLNIYMHRKTGYILISKTLRSNLCTLSVLDKGEESKTENYLLVNLAIKMMHVLFFC